MIIKNCPARANHKTNACFAELTPCDDITDCVMKQIVNGCRDIVKAGFIQNRYGCTEAKMEGYGLAVSILEKLEIEECENER